MRVELREHGSHVGTMYGVARTADPAPLPKESVQDDDGTAVHIRRYDKRERTAATPRTLGRLRHVHADAIAYTGMRTEESGMALVLAATLGLPLVLAAVWAGVSGVLAVVSGREALLPLFVMGLPFRLLWGTGAYLKGKTRIPVRWPSLVLERIRPVRRHHPPDRRFPRLKQGVRAPRTPQPCS